MFITAILLLLPMTSQAEIDIRFNFDDSHNLEIKYSEANIGVITDKEQKSFGINDEPLKAAVEVYSGKRPDNVFVRSPTPWNDLYRSYNWSQVTRTLKPVGSRILKLRKEPVIISSQELINNSSLQVTVYSIIMNTVSFTLESMRFVNDELEDFRLITYGVKINASYGDAYPFSARWGEDLLEEKTYLIGVNTATKVELTPHQKVVTNLTAVRVIADVELTYIASLDGHVACNYDNKYQGHHFYAYKINDVLDAAKMPKQKTFKEIIRIKFYSNIKLVVDDVETLKRLLEIDGRLWQ